MTPEFGASLCSAVSAAKRPVSALVNGKGGVCAVFLGDGCDAEISAFFKKRRDTAKAVRNYRLIRARADGRGLTENDRFTLINERLEMVGVITMPGGPRGHAGFEFARPSPGPDRCETVRFPDYRAVRVDSQTALAVPEAARPAAPRGRDCVFLAGASRGTQAGAAASLEELERLAVSAGKQVAGRRIHMLRPSKRTGNTVLGEANLSDLLLLARHEGAGAVIFDTELKPAEISEIQSRTDMKIIDRTQLILEIFSSRASSKEGRLQVKLAELKYALPRLAGSGALMSNPGAGIGTRGPGEKRLEKERRGLRKRIKDLERQMEGISARRERTKTRRIKDGNSRAVSLVGYTNAGKSTLFAALTKAPADAADKMFTTLATKTRRLYRPARSPVLLTDTVGFIKDLPDDLRMAFRATLEEIGGAGLLVHVADAGDPVVEDKITAVENVIGLMGFGDIPRLLAFNKTDTAPPGRIKDLSLIYRGAVFVSAKMRDNLEALTGRVDFMLGGQHTSRRDSGRIEHDFIHENAGAPDGYHPDRQRVTL
ncbi:MAG: GTPase HflX [Candidatus Dadabacteria bacterium]|nr:GTPase HflX [Candidatus Dadabacteria bacterium]